MKRIDLVFQDQHHNKFYSMVDEDSPKGFTVFYGRIGGHVTTHQYPRTKWESLYRQKVNKGYTDISRMKMAPGSAVRYAENKLGIITSVTDFRNNTPHRVVVFGQNGEAICEFVSSLSPGYLNPDLITHQGFYPLLVKKALELRGGA